MSARTLTVLGRALPSPEAPFDRLQDSLTADLLSGGVLSRERFARSWRDTESLRELALAKRAPLSAELARAMTAYHQRLGASPASLANLERLVRGEAVASVTGQQPAPLGGPLYSLHKTAGAVGLATVVTERTQIPCVPMYWMHGEDSDFDEIRGVSVSDVDSVVHDVNLPGDVHVDGGLVGDITIAAVATVTQEALVFYAGLAGEADARALWQRASANARDLGEATSALMLQLFADAGLVVVDPRLPEFRTAARVILDRYLANAPALEAAAKAAGARLESLCGKHPLSDASLDSFVFQVQGGRRVKIAAAEALAHGADVTLSPSVAMRPAVQDGVFPTVAMACGPGEIAYLAQLREVFEGVGVQPAVPVPRFGATWMPAEACKLLEASGALAWRVVAQTDAVINEVATLQIPAALEQELTQARAAAMDGLERFAHASRSLDPSLPQMVESARGKVDFQFSRLHEGLVGKVKGKLDKDHPAWRRLRYVLLPGGKLQERRLASLDPIARRGSAVVGDLCVLAAEHARHTAEGVHEHFLLEA